MKTHDLYMSDDANRPDAISDQNGQVALAMCKRCGKAELVDDFCRDELQRDRFEERAFNQRFLKSVRLSPGTAMMRLESDGCPTKAEFTRRNKNGDYVDLTLSAMWWAWCEALKGPTS